LSHYLADYFIEYTSVVTQINHSESVTGQTGSCLIEF
jgi:hypothetical protein